MAVENSKSATRELPCREYTVDFVPKIKLEMVADDEIAPKVIAAMIVASMMGPIGDGKIIIMAWEEVIRLRTGEPSVTAI